MNAKPTSVQPYEPQQQTTTTKKETITTTNETTANAGGEINKQTRGLKATKSQNQRETERGRGGRGDREEERRETARKNTCQQKRCRKEMDDRPQAGLFLLFRTSDVKIRRLVGAMGGGGGGWSSTSSRLLTVDAATTIRHIHSLSITTSHRRTSITTTQNRIAQRNAGEMDVTQTPKTPKTLTAKRNDHLSS